MVYRPLSHVGDDRRREQGAPVAIWRDRSRRIAESDHGLRQHSLAGFFLPEAAVVSSEPIAGTLVVRLVLWRRRHEYLCGPAELGVVSNEVTRRSDPLEAL